MNILRMATPPYVNTPLMICSKFNFFKFHLITYVAQWRVILFTMEYNFDIIGENFGAML